METQTELYEIRGNVADPTGQSELAGTEAGVDLTKNAIGHPKFRWRDRVSEVDVYAADGQLMLHFYCPQCSQALRVTSEQKEIRFSPSGDGGRISIAAFRCTWAQCGLKIRIVDNVAKDA